MKGIIFNLLEEFITEGWGEEKYEEILKLCPLHTKQPFVGPGTYPDEDLVAIATSTANKLGISFHQALKSFGKYCFPKLAKKYPDFLTPYNHPKDFLKTVDSIIHVEVKKIFRDAYLPKFIYDDPAQNRLIIEYESKRKLCQFMEGLIEGVSEYFKTKIEYKQTQCTLNGSKTCKFDLTFV